MNQYFLNVPQLQLFIWMNVTDKYSFLFLYMLLQFPVSEPSHGKETSEYLISNFFAIKKGLGRCYMEGDLSVTMFYFLT